MTDAEPQTHTTYRLLDKDHEVLDEAEWPNDGEAIAWAETHRSDRSGPAFRRIERRDGEAWTYVSEAGASAQDRGAEDV